MKRFAVLLFSAALLSSCSDDASGGISGTQTTQETHNQGEIIINTYTEPETIPEETTASTTTAPAETTASTTTAVTTAAPQTPSDDGQLVLIKDYIPDIILDIRYATTNNFTGTVIYENADAYLCYGTVKKLMQVQAALREKGLSLIIWDAYRPVEAQQKLWDVCPNPTFVADPRNGITSHSRGNTVDLGVVNADGSYIPVPSGFDEFSSLADRSYADVPADAAANSQMLEDIMSANGFYGYWGEWWHYSDYTEYQWHF